MKISGTVIPQLDMMLVRYQGTITIDANRVELRRLYASAHYRPGMAEVFDLSEATQIDAGFDDMLAFVKDGLAHHANNNAQPVMCIIVTQDTDQAIAEMYVDLVTALAEDYPVHIVQGYPEVFAILDLPPDSFAELPAYCQSESHLLS